MPLVKRSKSTNRSERKFIIGETFRKLIGKFHNNNNNSNNNNNNNNNKEGVVEKKSKNWRNASSSSTSPLPPALSASSSSPPSPPSSSSISKNFNAGGGGYYQTFENVDNHIDGTTSTMTTTAAAVTNDSSSEDVGEKSGRESQLPKQAGKRFYSSAEESSNNATNAFVSKKRVTATAVPPPASLVRRSSTLTNAKSNWNSNTNTNSNSNSNANNSNSNSNTVSYASQTLDRNYRVKKNQQQQQQQQDENMFKRRSPVQKYYLGEDPFSGSIYGREKEYDSTTATKPFRRKYKNANSNDDAKKSVRSHILNGMNNIFGGRLGRSISGKLPNSNSNQKSKKVHIDYTNRGGIQTLPRKSKKQVYINDPSSDQENLHSRKWLNRNSNSMINVSVINGGVGAGRTSGYKSSPDILGPEKPARTYRTSLLRSKSFNVQLGPYGYERSSSPAFAFKSNPQLHKLEESQAPLKSPSIVTSISRSTRDLSKSADDRNNVNGDVDDDYFDKTAVASAAAAAAAADYSKINGGYSTYDNSSSTRRRIFLKGLKHRAPELYKTLHEEEEFDLRSKNGGDANAFSSTAYSRPKHRHLEYSNSFHSGTRNSPSYRKATVSFESDKRSPAIAMATLGRPLVAPADSKNGGGSDDYSETVRITTKSNDPVRPSVTNTVQSFSKKTIPSKDGRVETIESSETTRVTKSKSHYSRGDDQVNATATATDSDNDNDRKTSNNRYDYSTKRNGGSGGGVVIEVRNDRK